MINALLHKPAPWLAGDGPEAAIAVSSRAYLVRNLADFPFPARSSDKEKLAIEERVVDVLDTAHVLTNGQYYSLSDRHPREARFLAERWLITLDLLQGEGPRGVYVGDDQSMSVMVNGADHICMQFLTSGLQFEEAWSRLDGADDALAGLVDFAFNDRFGYLTRSMGHAGTGLKIAVLLHLPGLAMTNQLVALERHVREQDHMLRGVKATVGAASPALLSSKLGRAARRMRTPHSVGAALYSELSGSSGGDIQEAQGDLYEVSNHSTLGRSEGEIVFNLKHLVADIIVREKEARDGLKAEERSRLKDRVGRALGVARGAHLLGFDEALELLSSLRVGLDVGLVGGYSVEHLNELMMASQSAHIELKVARECDALELSVERANLFRARLS